MKSFLIKLITLIGFVTTFKYNGQHYRVTDYVYIYKPSDYDICRERKFITVPKILSNGISGRGICGCVCSYNELESISFSLKTLKVIRLEKRHTTFNDIKTMWREYKFLRTIPKNYTWNEYQNYAMDSAVKSAIKSLKKTK